MKRTKRKLELARKTVTELTTTQLETVSGGGSGRLDTMQPHEAKLSKCCMDLMP